MPGPILEVGDELVLRTVEHEDAAFLQHLFTDPWTREGLHESGHLNEAQVTEVIEEEFESHDNAAFLACVDDDAPYGHPDEDDTTPVGFVGATHPGWDRPGLVHWVAPEHRGDGYGVEALELAVDTIFRTYDARSVGTAVFEGDAATRERVEALGFTNEGRNREAAFVEGAYRDQIQYGLLREEWGDE